MRFELDNETAVDMSVTAESDQPVGELINLGEFAIREKMTVLQLKEFLLSNWDSIAAKAKTASSSSFPAAPASRDCLRLRDGKVCLSNAIFMFSQQRQFVLLFACRILKPLDPFATIDS